MNKSTGRNTLRPKTELNRPRRIPSVWVGRDVEIEGMSATAFSDRLQKELHTRLGSNKTKYKVAQPGLLEWSYIDQSVLENKLRSSGKLPKPKTMRNLFNSLLTGLHDIKERGPSSNDLWVPLCDLTDVETPHPKRADKVLHTIISQPQALAGEVDPNELFEDDDSRTAYGVFVAESELCIDSLSEYLLPSLNPSDIGALTNQLGIPLLKRKGHMPAGDMSAIEKGMRSAFPGTTALLSDPYVVMDDGSGRRPLVEYVS